MGTTPDGHKRTEQTDTGASLPPLPASTAPVDAVFSSLELTRSPLRPIFNHREAHAVSGAVKLASKIFEPSQRNNLSVRQNVDLPFMPHAVDVAFQLLGAGAPPVAVVAGLLHDSFAGYVKGARELLAKNIDRKFGSLSKTGSVSGLLDIVAKPDRSEAAVWLERKNKIVGAILETVRPEDMRASPYSPEDVKFMVKAVWSAHNLFLSANPRPWGPQERLSMFRHAADVGLLLACAGQPKEVVAAGIMHDFYERYVKEPAIELIEQHVISEFGADVHEIIAAVTEPPKLSNSLNWWQRKLTVVNILKEKDERANTVVCAAKISTIAEGNKFLHAAGSIKDWSAGTWEDNYRVFVGLRDIFAEKGVCPSLMGRYDLELKRWRSHDPSKKMVH